MEVNVKTLANLIPNNNYIEQEEYLLLDELFFNITYIEQSFKIAQLIAVSRKCI